MKPEDTQRSPVTSCVLSGPQPTAAFTEDPPDETAACLPVFSWMTNRNTEMSPVSSC